MSLCLSDVLGGPHAFAFRNIAHETFAKWQSAGKDFPMIYGPRPRDVIVSSPEGGVMAEEAPPRARSRWNGIVMFFA